MPAMPTASNASRIAGARSGDVTTLSNVMVPCYPVRLHRRRRAREENERGGATQRGKHGAGPSQDSDVPKHMKQPTFYTNRQVERHDGMRQICRAAAR